MKLNHVVFPVVLIAACFACSSDDYTLKSRPYPSVETGDVTDISENGATLHGEFLQTGIQDIKDFGFIYNPDHSNTQLNDAERVSLGTTVQTEFSGVADHGLENGSTCW